MSILRYERAFVKHGSTLATLQTIGWHNCSIIIHMRSLFRYLFFFFSSFGKPPWETGISPPELMEFIAGNDPGRALDLGCGTGTNAITLAQHGWQVTGVDFIPRSIQQARRKADNAGVKAEFIVDSVTNLKGVSGPYQFILDIGCYQGLPFADREAYRKNIKRLLAPGGSLLIYGFYHDPDIGVEHGLSDQDFDAFADYLTLTGKKDSPDARGRASTWLHYVM